MTLTATTSTWSMEAEPEQPKPSSTTSNEFYAGYHINHIVLSHADDDHATGLVGVMERFRVDHLWMNRPWLYADQILHHFHGRFTLQGLIDDIKDGHPYLVELERLANEKGTVIHEVFQGAQIGAFTVLAPTRNRYIDSIPDFGKTPDRYTTGTAGPQNFGLLRSLVEAAKKWLEENWDVETLAHNTVTSASNESCVVQYAVLGDRPVLLTADVGPVGLTEAGNYGAQLGLSRRPFRPHLSDSIGKTSSDSPIRGTLSPLKSIVSTEIPL